MKWGNRETISSFFILILRLTYKMEEKGKGKKFPVPFNIKGVGKNIKLGRGNFKSVEENLDFINGYENEFYVVNYIHP